ncbi:MAG: dihydrofolate reductase [Bacteroidetes bacterium]|nr:dihydrofolate reductase [Bacteroidota bacterium]
MNKKDRPKISIYIAMSIDGFIAKKNHDTDWLNCVGGYDTDYGFKKYLSNVDTIILGRKTYDVAVKAYNTKKWPYTGEKLIVLSNTLKQVIDEAELYAGDISILINQLHSKKSKHIWIDGAETINQFLRLNIIDEMIISIIPILLGSGIELFNINKELPCKFISSQNYSSGLVQVKYQINK